MGRPMFQLAIGKQTYIQDVIMDAIHLVTQIVPLALDI